MSTKANHFKIGVFVLAALALLIFGLLAFGARSFFQAKTMFETAVVGDVYGLSVGSPVELRGVPIGQVTRIAFSWAEHPESKRGYVIVEFQVTKPIFSAEGEKDIAAALKSSAARGLRAMVKAQTITGSSTLAMEYLDPAHNPVPALDFTPRYYYVPSAPGQFTRLLEGIERALRNFDQLDLAAIGASVTNALGAASKLAEKLDQINLTRIGDNANSLIADVKVTNTKLQDTLDEIHRTIAGMKLDSVGPNADKLLLGLQETNDKLQRVLDKADALPLQQTLDEAQVSFETLNQVLLELKQYPSGFIFGQPPPPARSVTTPMK